MNVFNKVTVQSLKKNRARTIVTIIGIMLSAALICAVTTFTASLHNFAVESAVYLKGDWHASMKNVTTEEYKKVSNDERVSQCSFSQSLGYSKIESENKHKPYINVLAGNKGYFDMAPIHMVEGRLPENSDEIILSEQFHKEGNSGLKVGDKVTLDMGERTANGLVLGQEDPAYFYDSDSYELMPAEEEFKSTGSHTYTVVGVCEKPTYCEDYDSPGYTAFTVSDSKPADNLSMDIYYKMNNTRDVYSFSEEMGLETTYNDEVLIYTGVSRYDPLLVVLVSLAAIVIALIMFGSVALIYNAFSISVSERTKQFGLFSSIGATKKQLRKMVLFEAMAVSAIGVPLGILVGVGGIGITLMLIGHKFNSIVGGIPVEMKIYVTWQSILIAVIIALVTVLISAWIPAIRATRVSAVEAIRQSTDIKVNPKKIKTSKLTYKLFGLPGVLAVKQFKRNRKKYRATVVSLFMSIVLFVSASSFSQYLVDSATTSMSTSVYDLTYTVKDSQLNGKTPDEILKMIKSDKYVTRATYTKSKTVSADIPSEYISDQMWLEDSGKINALNCGCVLNFVEDEQFKKLLKDNNLNEKDFYNPEAPVAVAYDASTVFDQEQQKYFAMDILKGDKFEADFKAYKSIEGYYVSGECEEDGKKCVEYRNEENSDDCIKIPYDECATEYTLKSVKTIDKPALFMDTSHGVINLAYPMSMMDKVLPEGERESCDSYTFFIETDNHSASYDNISKALIDNNLPTEYFYNFAVDNETTKNMITIIQVFAYGFVIIISLISIANVFNTISTNISLRRREFAMLKSVGMTQKDFNKMMNLECLLYGAKALAFGLPASVLITYLIYRVISLGFATGFYLPFKAIAIAVISVFVVVFVTMMYAMRKIKKDNPIDALKNEN